MKIIFSNKNIGWWLFGLLHIIPIVNYFNVGIFTKVDDTFYLNPFFAVPAFVIGIIWVVNIGYFLMACSEGDIKFNFEIKIFHNYFERQRQRKEIKRQILELKQKAIKSIEKGDEQFEIIINQIVKLEERL